MRPVAQFEDYGLVPSSDCEGLLVLAQKMFSYLSRWYTRPDEGFVTTCYTRLDEGFVITCFLAISEIDVLISFVGDYDCRAMSTSVMQSSLDDSPLPSPLLYDSSSTYIRLVYCH